MSASDPSWQDTAHLLTGFRDRRDAGRWLAQRLVHFAERKDVIVLGLARGGVPVAYEIAHALKVPLDVFVVRKLGVPSQPELAMGAIASGGVCVLNQDIVRHIADAEDILETVTTAERVELERREKQYRGGRLPLHLEGKTIILTDDGLATGASMRAAVMALRQLKAAHIVAAVPVGAPETCAKLAREADETICLIQPAAFRAVGEAYDNFSQTSDAEVQRLLGQSALS
jgi:putative phosphoribosyl transferase